MKRRMMKKRKKRERERTRRGMACRVEDREDSAEAPVVPEPVVGIGTGGGAVAEDGASVAAVPAAAGERRRGRRWPLSRPPRGFCSCGDGHACAARGPRTAPPSPSSCTAYMAGSWRKAKKEG